MNFSAGITRSGRRDKRARRDGKKVRSRESARHARISRNRATLPLRRSLIINSYLGPTACLPYSLLPPDERSPQPASSTFSRDDYEPRVGSPPRFARLSQFTNLFFMPLNKTLIWHISNYGYLISTRFPRPFRSLIRSLLAPRWECFATSRCLLSDCTKVGLFASLFWTIPGSPPGPLGSYFSFGEARGNSNSFLVRLFPSYLPHPRRREQWNGRSRLQIDDFKWTEKCAHFSLFVVYLPPRDMRILISVGRIWPVHNFYTRSQLMKDSVKILLLRIFYCIPFAFSRSLLCEHCCTSTRDKGESHKLHNCINCTINNKYTQVTVIILKRLQ